jgi:adenylate cyclase
MVVVKLPMLHGLTHRLRAVLSVDVVDSVRLTKLDVDFISRWHDFVNATIHEEIPRHRGRLVKLQGDGMLVEFESAADAVNCALEMQARISRIENTVAPERAIGLRSAINFGDVVSGDLDLYGDAVNLAAR